MNKNNATNSPWMRFTSLALVLGFMSLTAFTSCRQEERPQPTQSVRTTYTHTIDMDLGEMAIDLQPTARSLEADGSSARQLDVKLSATGAPKLSVSTGVDAQGKPNATEDFPVYLVLRRNGQQVYGRATWELARKEDGSVVVRAKGQVNLSEEPRVSDLTIGDDKTWYLYAIHATGSDSYDEASRTITFKQAHHANRLYNEGDSLRLGKDLDVPFTLGYRDGNSRINGIPLRYSGLDEHKKPYFSMKRLSEPANNQPAVTLASSFRMMGSLYSLRLRNAMEREESWGGTEVDAAFIGRPQYRPTYDFSLKGFYVESTQASDEGRIDLKSLAGGGAGTNTPWATLSAVSLEKPYRVEFPLKDSVDLNRQQTTGMLVFWLKDTSEDIRPTDQGLNTGEGLGVWAELYNKTIFRNVGMTQILYSQKQHLSGIAYQSQIELKEELRLNPLARMGYDYIAGDPLTTGIVNSAWFALPNADNGMEPTTASPGAGQGYDINDLRRFQNTTFKVNYATPVNERDASEARITQSDLNWYVPDQFDIWSVFPNTPFNNGTISSGGLTDGERQELTQANSTGWVTAGKWASVHNERVRLDGVLQDVTSLYFRRESYNYYYMSRNKARNTFYALRFIGTPYMMAYRYTEVGKWYNPSVGHGPVDGIQSDDPTSVNAYYPSPNSRLVIEGKSLGHLRGQIANVFAAFSYLQDVVASNDFWGDEILGGNTNDGMIYHVLDQRTRNEIITRVLHVNGNKRSNAPYIGRFINIWTRERSDNYPDGVGGMKTTLPGIFQDHGFQDQPLTWHFATAIEQNTTNFVAYVLPWLALEQPNAR